MVQIMTKKAKFNESKTKQPNKHSKPGMQGLRSMDQRSMGQGSIVICRQLQWGRVHESSLLGSGQHRLH